MRPWHFSRIKIGVNHPHHGKEEPHQAPAGNWIFFWVHFRHYAKKTAFRNTFIPMHTLGLDGLE